MSDLTVVVINKNSGKYVRQTCLTILSQDFNNFKVIIIDSNSTDNSIDQIKSLKSDKIKIYNVDENINHHDAWLYGIKNVTSKYVAFMTSTDGYIDNQWFSTAISELEYDQKLSFVFANSLQRRKNEKLNDINQKFFLKFNLPSHESFLPFYLATNYHINELNCIWSTTVLKSSLESMTSSTENYNDFITYDLFESLEFQAIKNGFLGKYINTIANYGRIHNNSLTEKINDQTVTRKLRKNNFSAQRKFIFKSLKNGMIFKDRNFNEVSRTNRITFFNFYLPYLVYLIFFPIYRKRKPLYSLNYLFNKINAIIFDKFIVSLSNNVIKKLNKKKFFK
jgi:glycosyltransferase involved in cell wall biosynthesis